MGDRRKDDGPVWLSLLAIFVFFIFAESHAQEIEYCGSPSKKARKYFEEAEKMRFRGNDAYFLLRKAIDENEDFAEALLELGNINYKRYQSNAQTRGIEDKTSKNLERKFVEYYQRALENCPEIEGYRLNYLLGEHEYLKKNLSNAKAYFESYVSYIDPNRKNQLRDKAQIYIQRITEYQDLIKNPVPFEPTKVGGVSTDEDEYLPMLSPDNRYLFFTRKMMIARGATSMSEREMFIQSDNNYNGSFEKGIPMPHPFNQDVHQGGTSISVDNKLIFITVIEMVNVNGFGYPMGDIYFSEFREGRCRP